MVYKRYIIRGGKRFGPYYYKSYRDKNGIPRMEKVDKPQKTPLKLSYLLIGLGLIAVFLILFFSFNQFSNQKYSKISEDSINLPSASGNFLEKIFKFIGKVIEGEASIEEPTQEIPVEETPVEIPQEEVPVEEIPIEIPQGEIIIEEPIEIPAETIEETTTETSITEEPASEPSSNENESSQEIIINEATKNTTINIQTNETNQNITIENATIYNQTIGDIALNLTNQTLQNITIENKTLGKTNFTTEISTTHYSVRLGEPVKWSKKVKLDIIGEGNVSELTIELPSLAGNVSVKKTDLETQEEKEVKNKVENEKTIKEQEPVASITGNVVRSGKKINFFGIFKSFFSIIGRVTDSLQNSDEVLVNIQEEITEQDEIEIEYYTDAPYSEEIIFNEAHKKVTIIGPDEVHYEEVLVFSELQNEISSPNEIKIYWLVNESKELINFSTYDKDENGFYDYVEWIVPHLSNQTYEIILITNAIHLDSSRDFISNIYNEVKELDENWSEPINSEEYIRVTFEINLTSSKDITIYPRILNGTPRIEIYEKDKNDLIAEFNFLNENEYNKVYLTNLTGEQDTFDLKILNGVIEINHIIDPFSGGNGTSGNPYQITNCTDLQNVSNNLTSYFKLMNNIDCSDTVNWNSGAGFVPIGNSSSSFTGDFNGSNYNITDLVIFNSSSDYAGLFGYITGGTIYNSNLINANITGGNYVGGVVGGTAGSTSISGFNVTGNVTGNNDRVGGITGSLTGTISNSYFSGNVTGVDFVGGIVGENGVGTISNSYSSGNVNGNDSVGGAVGDQTGPPPRTISNSYSTSNIIGTGHYVGGFIGKNDATNYVISNSYSTGNVRGIDYVGGFAGLNNGNLSSSYSTGNITSARNYVGGFAGYNNYLIDHSNSSGNVTGNNSIGGFIGWSEDNSGLIDNSYSSGNVTGTNNFIGGFIGNNSLNITNSYSTGNVVCTGGINVSGFAGSNNNFINNSYSTGNVNCGNSVQNIGGFAGYNNNLISYSYSTGNVTAGDLPNNVGGFVGYNNNIINLSYSKGNITETGDFWGSSGIYFGGFAGYNNNLISYSYSTGNINGTHGEIGGFVGKNVKNISFSFSAGNVSLDTRSSQAKGGFVGINTGGNYIANYWDINTSGNYNDSGDDGNLANISSNNTINMVQQATFLNWDFASIWKINATYTYPCLQWQSNASCFFPLTDHTNPSADFGTNPTHNSNSQNTTITFDLKCSDNTDVSTLQLWGNWTGTWHANQTNSTPINNTYWNVSVSIPQGNNYVWAVYCNDTWGNSDWTNTNRTFSTTFTTNISTCAQLQNMNDNLNENYTLMNNINCSDTVNWNSGAGFVPISSFTGDFNGSNYNITDLYINRGSSLYVGLFGASSGSIYDVGLVDMNITGGGYVGSLVGYNTGTINNSYSMGSLNGTTTYVGGLIGANAGTINNSYFNGNVTGGDANIGGFAGTNQNAITDSYSTGNVVGLGIGKTGGFVGWNSGSSAFINTSYSNSNVTGTNNTGGFVGYLESSSSIYNSYSNSNVTGTLRVGGFAGYNFGGRNIFNSYSVGNVTGTTSIGGFVGANNSGNYVNNYWDINTTGNYNDSGDDGDLANIDANNTLDMIRQVTFLNWDFANVWKINETYSYPCLQWQSNASCIQPSLIAVTSTLPVYTNATLKKNTEQLILNVSISGSIDSKSICLIDVNGTNQSVAFSNGWCNSSSINLTNLADGNQTINVWANDSHNVWILNNSFVVFIDTTSPSITASCNPSSVRTSDVFPCSCSASDSGSGLSSSSASSTSPDGTATPSNTGPFTYTCSAMDNAGNSASSSIIYSVTGGGNPPCTASNNYCLVIEYPWPLEEDFTISPSLIILTLYQGEQKDKDILITNVGEEDLSLSLNLIGLEEFVALNDKSISLKVGESKTTGIIFSSNINSIPGLYNGKVEVSGQKMKKTINISLQILEGKRDLIFCGNNLINLGEQCDDGNLVNGDGCSSICEKESLFGNFCGNDIVNPGEQCDGDLNNKTCNDFGFNRGSLSCNSNCQLNTSLCINDFAFSGISSDISSEVYCGNKIINYGEQCDGDLNNKTCGFFGFNGGELVCKNCHLNTSLCNNIFQEKPEKERKFPISLTPITTIILLILLLIILLIYFILKKYIDIRNQLNGYESREERFLSEERLKRAIRQDNPLEKIIDKSAMALIGKD